MSKKSLFIATLATASIITGVGCNLARQAMKKAAASATSTNDSGGFLEDGTAIPAKFKARIGGPVRILEMTVHAGFVSSQIQDPKKPLNVDEYELRGGDIGESAPVKFMGKQPTEKDLERVTFDIDTVDFSQVAKMVKDAPVQLKYENGHTTHLILKRPLPFSNDVLWRVYVSSDRRNGSVEYRPNGTVKKVYQ